MKKIILSILLIVSILLGITACSDVDDENTKNIETKEEKTKKEEGYKELSLYASGDIMFHSSQLKSAYDNSSKEYDFKEVFEPVKSYFENADIAIANFETTTAGSEMPITSYPSFNSPDSTVDALKYSGVDILTTANNHSLDTGRLGVVNTIKNIENNDMEYVGSSEDEYRPFIIKEANDIKLSFLSYTYGLNGNDSRLTSDELDNMINLIDEEKMKSDIKEAKQKTDKVVVFIHWGNEYSREPNEFQVDLANKMFDWGADVILGSHPHVIQKSELIEKDGEDKFIIYSMGNFISNQRRETLPNTMNNIYTEDGVMVNINFKKDLKTDKVVIDKVKYEPTWVHKYSKGGKDKYEILPTSEYMEDENLSEDIRKKLEESHKHTMDLMETSE